MLRSQRQAGHQDLSEETLVWGASAGDGEAFADLYVRHLEGVFRYFYYRVGNREDAEDLTEQVFLKAWQAIRNYDARGIPFSGWVFRIAHNLAVDHYRTRRNQDSLNDDIEIRDERADVDAHVMRNIEAEELACALQQLSHVDRSVLILRFVQGLDHRTVGRIIGKSEVATRSIQSRALDRLAAILEPLGRRVHERA